MQGDHRRKALPPQAALPTCAGRRGGAPHLPAAALWPALDAQSEGRTQSSMGDCPSVYRTSRVFKTIPLFEQKSSNALVYGRDEVYTRETKEIQMPPQHFLLGS